MKRALVMPFSPRLSAVVPAKAGTHTPFAFDGGMRAVQIARTRIMGPRFRGDDSGKGVAKPERGN
jgi:hypothetical protein